MMSGAPIIHPTGRAEYPNLVMIALWDQCSQDHSAGTEFGNLIAPSRDNNAHVLVADTLKDLAAGL
jgi:3-oxosteroid 1-dehydrogenase